MYLNNANDQIIGSKRYSENQQMIQSFLSIDIDANINQSSISKKYKWITSLQLISADQFKQKIFVKQRNPRYEDMVKHFQIDKLLYLVVTFCQDGKLPIARIRTRKQMGDSEWKTVTYPKQYQGFYEHNICYQYTQSKQCKRIITDIEVCHGKQFEDMSRSQDQWQIATFPEPTYRLSKIQRPTRSESEESVESRSNPFNMDSLQGKFSDRSEVRQNTSNLSQNSFYSCNDYHSKSSIEKDHFSDIDDVHEYHSNQMQSKNSNQMNSKHSNQMQSKHSSMTDFQSIEETSGPFYFLMKTIDLYDNHNQFQYTYEPKIFHIQKVNPMTNIQQKYLRSIAKFCFPNGIRLFKKITGCGFQTFTLILTTDQGQRYFAYCLKYRQRMTQSVEDHLLKELYQLHLIQKNQTFKSRKIFNQKVFCLVSKIQNTDVFHKILQNLYRALLSFSSPEKGSEYFSNLKGSLDQRRLQFFALDLVEKLRAFSKNLFKRQRKNTLDPMKVIPSLPIKNEKVQFKWCGVNTMFSKKQPQNKVSMKSIYCLFKLLSVENIIKILEAALLEKKIFIVSSIQVSILLVIQGLIGILHPLRLSQPIIPVISEELLDLIEAPIPIVAGIGQELVNENTMTKAVYVFLDCNKILALQDLPALPVSLQKLQKELKKFQMYNSEHVIEFLDFKDEVYSLGIHEIQQFNSEIHQEIKSLLKDSIVSIIKNYASCYSKTGEQNLKKSQEAFQKMNQHSKQVQSQRISKSTSSTQRYNRHLTFKQMYNTSKFIKLHQKKQQPFYEEFCKSSIFKNLIQQKYNNFHNDQIQLIDRAIQHIQEDVINHLSCLSIPVSSLKKESFDYKKRTAVKAKAKHLERQIDERGSLTTIKQQQMKKNLSLKEQQNTRKLATVARKATNIPIQRESKVKQDQSINQNEMVYSQRMSEGGVYRNQKRPEIKQQKQVSQYRQQHQHKSVGFKICSMVNNMTKKITDSRTNIVNIFSEAKVNRLKKVYIEENKDKNPQLKKHKEEISIQYSQNHFFHQTSPQIVIKTKTINGDQQNVTQNQHPKRQQK